MKLFIFSDESEESFSTFKNVFLNYLDEATPLSNFPKDDFTIFNGDFQNKRNVRNINNNYN